MNSIFDFQNCLFLGVGAKYDASTDEDIVTQERTVHTPDGKEVTCKFFFNSYN